ncbi:MAG: type II toxin-antitoxin system RelE/ParE family toxin [Spirochaetaceae bacterium]
MQKLKLIISDKAILDLYDIWEYISADNTNIADNFIDQLHSQCEKLCSFPKQGRTRDYLRLNVRSITYKKYIIFYLITHDAVEIVRILNGFRDIESLI